MNKLISVLAICCIVVAVPTRNSGKVVVNDEYQFEWTLAGDEMYFTVTAQTTGFVGFGIFPENGLDNEDVCIFGLSPNGTAYLDDYHSLQPSDPKILDTTDGGTVDWFLVEISEDGNATTTTFYRKLETGDDIFFDQPIYPGEMKLIWSYGEMDLEYFDNVTFNAETTGRFDVVLIEP
ncbi:DBH-like monooxygenase protein 2 [Artemia franciscana]|uniref:DBH-like monooxygenase protein 2 n=1 Tax=Artemia franciscana TaxID=6661 RepID=UPI0032DB7DD0